MLKIGFDVSAMDASFKAHCQRGIGRYVRELSNYFEHRDSSDVEVERFDHTELGSFALADALLSRFPIGKITAKQQFLYPLKLGALRKRGIEVLHFPAHMDPPSWCPMPYVVTVLDLIPWVRSDLYRPDIPGWRFKLARFFEQRAIKNASLVLAISENTARDVERILNVPPERIAVTPLGVDKLFFEAKPPEDEEELRSRYKIPPTRPIILYLGGIDQRKNYRCLLDVVRLVIDREREEERVAPLLLIAGPIHADRQYPKLLSHLQALKLEEDVLMPGFVADEDLLQLMAISRVFLTMTLYEGFGLPVLEAMAAGLPVVSSNSSCMPEVVGEAGLMVDPEDREGAAGAVCRILNQPELAESLRQKGREHAHRFPWSRTGELTIAAYQNLLEAQNLLGAQ